MRGAVRIALLVSLLLAGSGGEAAWAKPKVTGAGRAPARAHVLPPRPTAAQVGLRGELAPDIKTPIVATPTAAPSLPDLVAARPPALKRLGQGEGTLASAGLIGLRSHADLSPVCRSTCAQARYQCAAGDGATNCDGTWSQCVLTCRQPVTP